MKTPPHTTFAVCITRINLLTLVREIVSVCGLNRKKHTKHCVSQLYAVATLRHMEHNYSSDLNGQYTMFKITLVTKTQFSSYCCSL
jgi:hypothetical protein